MVFSSSAAPGDVYSSNVMINIPGNNSNPAEGSCDWQCFKPEVTQVSVYIVPESCASQSNQLSRDWCSDITAANATSCRSFAVLSGDQSIPWGSMSFVAYGPNAAQSVGQMHYRIYAAAGGSCDDTYNAIVGGTPNPTVYLSVLPNCGSELGAICPVQEEVAQNPPPCTRNCSGNGNNGDDGDGDGNGSGTGTGGGGGGSSANKQGNNPNTIPSSSAQGDANQPDFEASPFFDGKQYEPGSDPDLLGVDTTFSIAGHNLKYGWAWVIGLVTLFGAGGYYFWKKKPELLNKLPWLK